jgi:ABC-type polysaccharide/polyol phosphate export permease
MIAWKMESTQGFHAVMNLLLIPMWLLSGAFFPAAGASPWMGFLMRFNPLTYGMASVRWALDPNSIGPDSSIPSMAISIALTFAFAIAAFVAATRMASAPLDPDLV